MGGGEAVDDHVGQIIQHQAHGRRNAHGEDGAEGFRADLLKALGDGQNALGGDTAVDADEVNERDDIGQHGGQGRTQDLPAVGQEDEHEDGVQDDVQHAAETHAEARLLGAADVAEHSAHGAAEDGGQTAQNDHAQEILPCIADGHIAGAKKPQQRIHEHQADEREQQGRACSHQKAQGGNFPCLLRVLSAHKLDHQIAAADTEEVGNARRQQIHRADEAGGRHHIGVVRHADEPGIGNIIDEGNDLADDGGDRHDRQGLGNAHPFKNFDFICCSSHCAFFLSLSKSYGWE